MESLRETEAKEAYQRLRKAQRLSWASLCLAFAGSVLTALCLSQVNYSNSLLSCVLGAEWDLGYEDLQTIQEAHNRTRDPASELDPRKRYFVEEMRRGKPRECHLLHFGHAASAVLALISLWFLCLFRPSLSHLRKRLSLASAKIIPLSILVGVAGLGLCLAASVSLQIGVAEFCSYVTSQGLVSSCSGINAFAVWRGEGLSAPLGEANFFQLIVASMAFTWLAVAAWAAFLGFSLWRILAHLDFPAYYFRPLTEKDRSLRNQLSANVYGY